ncbi:hypothetical protein [Streptomyces chiangmaiensis]|uniref:Uncharacterized protein n=1 Tax=Streptomyces chiangmaiensis TaxID=766497 RepID=A0ABU7FXP9_9ACTN|nr:hypothetical protein [Streptomyces chiangmaiensis]MED7828697.1 hypothetical protein [Streptomyces chiangmaiensis]
MVGGLGAAGGSQLDAAVAEAHADLAVVGAVEARADWEAPPRLGSAPASCSRLQDLRHCAAPLSLAVGLHMKAVQTSLGHFPYSLTADTCTSVLP